MPIGHNYARTHPQSIAARRRQRQRWIQIRARRIGRLYPDLVQDPVVLARLAKTPLCPARAQRLARAPGLRREARFNLQSVHRHTGRIMFGEAGRTSATRFIRAFQVYKQHPEGRLRIGVGSDPESTRATFLGWFHDRAYLKSYLTRQGRRVRPAAILF